MRRDLQLSGYPQLFINSVLKSRGSCRPEEEERKKPLRLAFIPYVKGISEKFKRIGNRYIRTVFKTKHTLRSSLMRTRLERSPQQTANCIYSIPCECGRSYIGETGRPLAVHIHEHRHNLRAGLLEKSKLAQHVYEERHRVGWDEARILEIESRYRKYKESAHMACSTDPISQPSLEISPIWIPLVSKDVSTSKERLRMFLQAPRYFYSRFNLCVIDAPCGRVAVYSGCISFITVLGFLDGF
jgi:hypothetical protein